MARCLLVWRHAFPFVIFWAISVPGLAAVPIGFHLWSVVINKHTDKAGAAWLSDLALYAFIVSMAGVTECLAEALDDVSRVTESKLLWLFLFAVDAVIASAMYFASLIETVVTPGLALSILKVCLYALLVALTLTYLPYKLPVWYGRGQLELVKKGTAG